MKISGSAAGDGAGLQLEQIPLAPLRWEQVSISIEGLDHIEDVEDQLLDRTRSKIGGGVGGSTRSGHAGRPDGGRCAGRAAARRDSPNDCEAKGTGFVRQIGQEGPAPRALGLRARLTGASPCHEDIGKRRWWRQMGRLAYPQDCRWLSGRTWDG